MDHGTQNGRQQTLARAPRPLQDASHLVDRLELCDAADRLKDQYTVIADIAPNAHDVDGEQGADVIRWEPAGG